ncbi:MAG: formate dehydrogenase subunit alpha [Chloroflexota bacterium]
MDTVKLTIDGKEVTVARGTTVLEAANSAGVYIPTLCYHSDLEPYGGCRLCVVEIEKMRGLPTACTTPATEGMVVHTETPAVDKVRRTAVELLIADHQDDCLVCSQNQHCELQKVASYLGIVKQPFRKLSRISQIDTSNPFFNLDRSKCILCARCVRTCNEVVGAGAIDLAYRGYQTKVATFGDGLLKDSICQSCGECVAHCPTGALTLKEVKTPSQEVLTTCPYCGVGCQVYLGTRGGRIVSIRGKNEASPNNGWLCVKGRFGVSEFVHHPERLTTPLIRKEGELTEATWDEALSLVATKLRSYESDKIAVITSAKCTNEDNYVAQKFARSVLKTNSVDHCARLCHASTLTGLAQSFGAGAMTNSIGEIRNAGAIFVIGSNTTEAHPVIGFEIKRAVKRGAKLIVANPRNIDLNRFARVWLRHMPGTDVALLMGMMRVIVDEGLTDEGFITERTENFPAFRESLKHFDLKTVSGITGVPEKQIIEAARLYATSKPGSIIYSMGITQSSHGTDNVLAIANLAMLTGNVGKPASGVNPLRGQNNVQGACDMGALPNFYPGYQPVSDAGVREKFEKAWGVELSSNPGLAITEMMPLAHEGRLKALYLIGENPALSEPDATHAQEALSRLDFLVVQDIFLTETARLAHVVLPGVSFAEKDGTFTSTERRVQRVRKAVEPVGSSRPDWLITAELAKRMGGKGFDYQSPRQIIEEISSLTPSYAGISYARLEPQGIQWPCPAPDHPGTPILHTRAFSRGKGKFMPLEYKAPKELPDAEFPLILTTGRALTHFHTGTMTRRVKGLNLLRGEEEVVVSPEDAASLGIQDGEMVKVSSRRGLVIVKARVSESSPKGVVFMTFHFAESPTNVLTNPALDPVAKIPELKVCAVRIEKSLTQESTQSAS